MSDVDSIKHVSSDLQGGMDGHVLVMFLELRAVQGSRVSCKHASRCVRMRLFACVFVCL